MKYITGFLSQIFKNNSNELNCFSELNRQYKDQGLQFDDYGNPLYLSNPIENPITQDVS